MIKRRTRRNSLRRLIFIRLHACSVSYTHTYAHDRCVRTREISAIAETNENEFRKNRKIKTSIQCSARSVRRDANTDKTRSRLPTADSARGSHGDDSVLNSWCWGGGRFAWWRIEDGRKKKYSYFFYSNANVSRLTHFKTCVEHTQCANKKRYVSYGHTRYTLSAVQQIKRNIYLHCAITTYATI